VIRAVCNRYLPLVRMDAGPDWQQDGLLLQHHRHPLIGDMGASNMGAMAATLCGVLEQRHQPQAAALLDPPQLCHGH
jgi:hypothetical protein